MSAKMLDTGSRQLRIFYSWLFLFLELENTNDNDNGNDNFIYTIQIHQ